MYQYSLTMYCIMCCDVRLYSTRTVLYVHTVAVCGIVLYSTLYSIVYPV